MAGADPDSRDSQEVSPFQLAVWQNQLEVARYLVERCGVDPTQLNVFACGAQHLLGTTPSERAGPEGVELLPTARWLRGLGVDFHAVQRQGIRVRVANPNPNPDPNPNPNPNQDDPFQADSIMLLCEQCGYKAQVCSNGTEALEVVRTDASINLVLSDVMMAGVSGYELLCEIRKIRNSVSVGT